MEAMNSSDNPTNDQQDQSVQTNWFKRPGPLLLISLLTAGVLLASTKLFNGSSSNASTMCADAGVVETAKKLINDRTPNFGRLGDTLQKLDAARGGGAPDILADREKNLRDTKNYYAQNPVDPNDKSMGDQNEARAKRIADLEAELAPLRQKAERQRSASNQLQNATNEILVSSEPIPIRFDPDLNRAACKLTYKVKGLGYDNPMMQLNLPNTAVYTVQPGQNGWIVELLDLS